jgi:hypothetical protein
MGGVGPSACRGAGVLYRDVVRVETGFKKAPSLDFALL